MNTYNQSEVLKLLNDNDLIKALEEIDDLAAFRNFKSTEDAELITKELLSIDILSLSYEARETLLHTFFTLSSNYNLASVDFRILEELKDRIEIDLVDYINDLY